MRFIYSAANTGWRPLAMWLLTMSGDPVGKNFSSVEFRLVRTISAQQNGLDVVVGFGRLGRQDALRCGGGTHRGFLRRLGMDGGWRRRFWQSVSLYHRSLLVIEKRQYDSKSSRVIIAVSKQVKSDILANYSVPAEKIVVLYNGVDKDRFHPARRGEVRDKVRNRWKIPFDAPLVLFVGSGFRRKGLDRLLSIWEVAAAR